MSARVSFNMILARCIRWSSLMGCVVDQRRLLLVGLFVSVQVQRLFVELLSQKAACVNVLCESEQLKPQPFIGISLVQVAPASDFI